MVYTKPITHVERVEAAAPRIAAAPGIPETQAIFTPPFFAGALREWPSDEVGWTKIQRTKLVGYGDERRAVKCSKRDHTRAERKYAGWNLDLM